ncbi:ABC transporter substrate-binding protein [Achromobacter sp. NFACC18-2]|uniref:ABC transporter substrate-binding protein n=1 Tax=Achromobacter sp. NFACC18-2 TaxID=1564112 RepID=UPI000ABC2FDD|nr:ABC transporter substrate-binding protein [Achromobacter sp. NFACC18-2]
MKRSFMFSAAMFLAVAGPLAAAPTASQAETSAKFVMHAPLRVLDPILTSAYVTRNHGYLVYDTLFSMDAAGRPQPQMVESWKVSEDGMAYTFKLRPGLVFHDGAPVTADDVVASLQRWEAGDATIGNRLKNATAELAASGADTFTLKLKTPYGLVLESLAKESSPVPFIMPKRIASAPASQAITETVGSGPYRFVQADFQAGVKATYVKFAGYVPRKEPASAFAGGKVAKVDRLELVNIPDSQTAVNALRNGEIDFLEDVPPDLMPQLKDAKGIALKSYGKNSNMFTLRMNWLQAPFNNVKVRRAALAALYQQDYLDAQIGDPEVYQVCGAVLTCVSPYASEEGATQIKAPDLAHARKLLKESGYAGEKVVVLHPTDLPIFANIAPVTAQALRSIGMNVEIQSMDWATLLSRRSKKEGVDEGGWSIFQSNMSSLDLISAVGNPNLDGRAGTTYPGWTHDEVMDSLRNRFAAARSEDERRELALAIQRRNYEQVMYVPLGGYSKFKGYNAKFADLVDAPIPLFWTSPK